MPKAKPESRDPTYWAALVVAWLEKRDERRAAESQRQLERCGYRVVRVKKGQER